MIGHSYVGSTLTATMLKPKGLVTIVPSAGLPAIYDHQWQLGVAYNAQYLGPIGHISSSPCSASCRSAAASACRFSVTSA